VSLAYFDTSALVKNYVREAGSSRIRALLTRYEFLSSAITPIELQSAVQRRRRQREIDQPDYNSIISRIGSDRSYWQLVEVVPQVLSKAEELLTTASIRTLDAIHIASAMIIQDSLAALLPFISADEKQLTAAQNCKLSVIAIVKDRK
jgi:predicted nucleic acid-binding protein